jgi:hypothetical protein
MQATTMSRRPDSHNSWSNRGLSSALFRVSVLQVVVLVPAKNCQKHLSGPKFGPVFCGVSITTVPGSRATIENNFDFFPSTAMRELKHHEQRLLKRVDFLNYKQDQNHRDLQIIRRYHIQSREDYFK